MPVSKKQHFSNSNPTEEIRLFFQVQLILMLLAHWNSFSLFKNHPIHQQGLLPPTNNQHICSAASPCWLCRGKVPKVDVKHVKCYLPYLPGHWIFMSLDTGVSLQPAVQRTSSSLYSRRTSWSLRHAAPSILPRDPLSRHIYVCFLIRWWFRPKLTIASCSNLCTRGAAALLALRRSGTSLRSHPAKKREGITPCSALMPIYFPWHLRGHALTSAGILPPSSPSLMRFLSAPRKTAPNSLCITRAFRRPGRRSASSRLPWLLFGSAAELRCGSDSLRMAAEFAVVVSLNICFLC